MRPSMGDPRIGSAGGRLPRSRVSTDDIIYAELREMLTSGQIAPGAPLSEEVLAQSLGVSRTPLRQALSRLRFEGLVQRSTNGRHFAGEVSEAHARDLFSVRIALETLAIEEAFPHLTPESLTILRGTLAQADTLVQQDGHDVGNLGRVFHATIYDASSNQLNLELLAQIQSRIDQYRYLSTGTGADRQRAALKEHRLIFEALEANDLVVAKRLLREHLENARKSVITAIRKSSEGTAGPEAHA